MKLMQGEPDRPTDSSIAGIKPVVTPFTQVPPQDLGKTKTFIAKKHPEALRRCCCRGNTPTMKASYSIEGAVVVQYYCDKCAERELPLH
jgi:hypothetical protein